MVQLRLHPDRLLPTEPGVRDVAREIYTAVKDLPIVSPHGHVPARWLADDVAFEDPTSLLITPDHYVTRLLHAQGVRLDDLGVGRDDMDADASRAAFRALCAHWDVYRGTVVRTWLEAELVEVFGVDVVPSAHTADAIYDRIAAQLAEPAFRARALYERFDIEVLATTDDPCDDLADHRRLAEDPAWTGRVIPTFRPDRYLEPAAEGWNAAVDTLGRTAGTDVDTYGGWVEAMELRRAHFRAHGATSTDHSHRDVRAEPLERSVAEELYLRARKGDISAEEGDVLRRDLLFQMARMAADDGLVMTLHPAVLRNHHGPTHRSYGADVGADIPLQVEFTQALRPMLEAFGTHPGFQLVLFTLDETVYSRELAPLAGFYPSVYVGAPWWFIDAPDAMQRYRAAVTETAGFTRTSGFIDDTRAFLSIPARHDVSRRVDAGFLARLVAEHRLTADEAVETAHDLVLTNPKRAFRL
ncbi:glucuronate isomerase [Actinotalea sp. Marseille-Q4924]|uniref:glucuronate isomerase n=1 Tax=Actinotalea sp. Marseille-Q4924 TaxID=2866571 RepID=UPI001CE3BF71|nr:glucuronate isomerase [Actinotalea sp. Marseille-Q4924]